MLKVKRLKFEEQFDVPEAERLSGDGWIAPFCKAYGYKERRRHGEAGSVDIEAVEEERKRIGMILATYAERDQWNADESSLFVLWVAWLPNLTLTCAGSIIDKLTTVTVHHQIEGLLQHKWLERRKKNLGLQCSSRVTQMEASAYRQCTLVRQKSRAASKSRALLSVVFIIATIRRLGWPLSCLKSKKIISYQYLEAADLSSDISKIST
jgi:hypothetical protein